MKTCVCCNRTLDISHFYTRRSKCKECYHKLRAEYYQQYRKDNKETIQQANKIYFEANKEKLREYSKQYYEKNHEVVLQKAQEYRQKNKEKRHKWESARRARKLLVTVSWDKELTDFVVEEAHHLRGLRDTYFKFKWHVDHIIPLRSPICSGLHVWNNFQVIPAKFNCSKRHNSHAEYRWSDFF